MSYHTITFERRGAIGYLNLARPDHGNRLGEIILNELVAASERITDDEELRAVILAARGHAFCLGWESSHTSERGTLGVRRRLMELADSFNFLARLPKPIIAAIQGDALSAGLEMALSCDIRLASPEAHFGLPEVAEGYIPMAGGTQRLPRLVGRGKALEMILTGQIINAEEANHYGLVHRVVPSEGLLEEALAMATTIAEHGPIAVAYAKEAVRRGLDMPLEQALRLETDLTIILQTTQDRAEGISAFKQKRPPRFHGH